MASIDNFRNYINGLIESDKLSLVQLHKLTGISRTLLYGYFKDGKDIDLNRAEAIANAVGVSLKDVIGGNTPKIAPPRALSEEELMAAVIERSRLSKEKKQSILDILLQ